MKKTTLIITAILMSFCAVAQSSEEVSLDEMIGQMIMTGIGDFPTVNEQSSLMDDIRNGYVGGVIFFEKNVDAKLPTVTMQKTINQMQEAAEVKLFIAIDEEGGRVNRLRTKYGFPPTQTAQWLGKMDDLDTTRYYANNTASTLSMLGFNLNFAPDVDVNVYPQNPVIGKIGRSYSPLPEVVARHAAQVVKIHRKNNVITALKHFPGHGSSHADTHYGVADVSDYWQFHELLPYKKLIDDGNVDCVMTAHIVNKNLDPDGYPATLSPYIVSNVLRNFLGFDGVVFTDDMQMHAISRNFGFEESIKLAINAGVDMMVFANNVPGNERRTPREIHGIIKGFVEAGEISEEEIKDSYDRLMKLKRERL